MNIRPVGAELFYADADGPGGGGGADRHDDAIRYYANAANKSSRCMS